MKRIHIVGKKNSGKTTLVAALVRHLTAAGLRIGTVKHTHHRHTLDTPGKDSFRHHEAGAAVVGILSKERNAVFWENDGQRSSSSKYEHMAPLFADCDLVLVEGDSQSDGLKVEVWRAANHQKPLAADDPSIVAIVTDDPLDLQAAVRELAQWPLTDVATVASHLLQLAGVAQPTVS